MTLSPRQLRTLRAAAKPGGLGIASCDGRSSLSLKKRGLIEARDSTICPNHFCYYATITGRALLVSLGYDENGRIATETLRPVLPPPPPCPCKGTGVIARMDAAGEIDLIPCGCKVTS